ncbi:hypothetical protein L873DRAFT_1050090 [Choiromyces venosus 120613-1]|uniref:Uncharacterized protein n=1 Tax=Choiromyces venosus 120613-1 TaxID=1336337 RepID=A0A3N4JQB4_9PEZI|nr:hypothetical protein L873DRAFT_1050090 [Choiromyces venosus 120613-1]
MDRRAVGKLSPSMSRKDRERFGAGSLMSFSKSHDPRLILKQTLMGWCVHSDVSCIEMVVVEVVWKIT